MFYGTKRFRYSAISKPLVEFVEDISDVYSQKHAVQYLREKCVICRHGRRCILCNSQEKILIFLGTAQLAALFLILKNFIGKKVFVLQFFPLM